MMPQRGALGKPQLLTIYRLRQALARRATGGPTAIVPLVSDGPEHCQFVDPEREAGTADQRSRLSPGLKLRRSLTRYSPT